MIYYLPIEHVEQRYSIHLDRDICDYVERHNLPVTRIYPEVQTDLTIKQGSFLDAPTTIGFKSRQIAAVAELYANDVIQDGDTIFTTDIWFPGIESIAYLNYFCKKNVKLRGVLHAGSFTDTDFVRDMERWAKNFEDAVFDIADEVFVASEFLRQDVIKKRMINPDKLTVTGLPLDQVGLDRYKGRPKTPTVVFNGRNVDEKQPWLFDRLKERVLENYGGVVNFVNTQERGLSKEEYYDVLSEAKVVVSFALQENFGFGILEAAYLGSVPIVPNKLVYPEHFNDSFLYDTFDQCCGKVMDALDGKIEPPVVKTYENAIPVWLS